MLIYLPYDWAFVRGIRFYYEGPCAVGHVSLHSTHNRQCVECHGIPPARAVKASKPKKETSAESRPQRPKLSPEQSREKKRKLMAAWRETNPDRTRDTARRSMSKWRAENREVALAREAAWREANPGKVRAAKRKRRLATAARTPRWFGEFDQFVLEEAYAVAAARAALTGVAWHVDHMVPLLARNASGLHCAANLQVIPERLNRRKSNKLWLSEPLDWLLHI